MKTNSIHASLLLLAGLMLPTIALAHPGHAGGSVFVQGFVHPFTGVDHLLAMLASGMWAAQMGGRARWQVPLVFVVAMIAGAVAGMQTGAMPLIETGIVVSVIALGLLVAGAVRAPQLVGAVVVAAFAALHGHAHGSEMAAGEPAVYITGFALATLLLHGAAVLVVTVMQARHRVILVRAAGAMVAAAGAMLFAV